MRQRTLALRDRRPAPRAVNFFMHKLDKLQLLNNEIAKCTRCPELSSGRTLTVPGEGNPNTRLMIAGEGPGKNEDEQGRPFVGKAGDLLTSTLVACGLRREDVFICNVVKCRPPHNRLPTVSECANCLPFLTLQIKIIKPEIILCLGGTAARNILHIETPVGHLRNQVFGFKLDSWQAKVVVSWHPAYLLRNPAAKKESWDDFQLVCKLLERS